MSKEQPEHVERYHRAKQWEIAFLRTKKDLKSSYMFSIIIAIVSTAIMVAILWLSDDPTQIFTNGDFVSILFVIGYIGMKIGLNYLSSVILTMSADISDYETSRSGRFVSGLIGTVFSLTDSISSSLAPNHIRVNSRQYWLYGCLP